MMTGAAVNAATKSGTNQIHGALFELVRNDLFNARNYFATTNSYSASPEMAAQIESKFGFVCAELAPLY